jgi:hypothetical protein
MRINDRVERRQGALLEYQPLEAEVVDPGLAPAP